MSFLSYADVFDGAVTAFTTDVSVDFLQADPQVPDRFALTARQTRALGAAGLSGGVIFPKQVHGDLIWEVGARDAALTGLVEADAVVTAERGLAVAVRTADCVPILLFAPDRQVIAAVHAGWKSTKLEIVRKTVELLRARYQVDTVRLQAVIGPCIRPASYPVGVEFREYFPQEVTEREGRLCLDVPAANRRQLLAAGVMAEHIADCGADSYADPLWHSFRRDAGRSGRMLSAILIR